MTNDMEGTRRLERVTPEIFAAFLSAKNSSQSCLSCGSINLFVPRVDNAIYGASLNGSPSSATNEYVTHYKIRESLAPSPANCEYRVICTNCGYTSYYWALMVELWLETDLFPSEQKGGKE